MKITKNPLLIGTAILTIAGLLTRLIGFFYRVFLSHSFGEEGMGIFQLTTPILSLSYAFAISGIQTAISKYVATQKKEDTTAKFKILFCGLLISALLSCLCTAILYFLSDTIATVLLSEPRTAPLIRLIALSLPFGAVHCCINGYFYGQKTTLVPAGGQLIEQIFRVASVIFICSLLTKNGKNPSLAISALGLFIGEIVSTVFALVFIWRDTLICCPKTMVQRNVQSLYQNCRQILSMAIPLSMSRLIVHILGSIETVFLPLRLKSYGYSSGDALRLYGVLTGMALPLILFPSAITNSLSVILLPTVSEAQAEAKNDKIQTLVSKSLFYCFLIGLVAMFVFLLFGKLLGTVLFHSEIAGTFITRLSFVCPLLYISATLSGIINGLGKTKATLLIQVLSVSLRLLFIFLVVPKMGVDGYLLGLIISQFLHCISSLLVLRNYISLKYKH